MKPLNEIGGVTSYHAATSHGHPINLFSYTFTTHLFTYTHILFQYFSWYVHKYERCILRCWKNSIIQRRKKNHPPTWPGPESHDPRVAAPISTPCQDLWLRQQRRSPRDCRGRKSPAGFSGPAGAVGSKNWFERWVGWVHLAIREPWCWNMHTNNLAHKSPSHVGIGKYTSTMVRIWARKSQGGNNGDI